TQGLGNRRGARRCRPGPPDALLDTDPEKDRSADRGPKEDDMFRLSKFMQEIVTPTPIGPRRDPPGPVVIWNLIRRCNLLCKHCYSISGDVDFPGELSADEVFTVMDDLR